MATTFEDDFNRADSDTVDNGWIEFGEDAATDCSIDTNELTCQYNTGV